MIKTGYSSLLILSGLLIVCSCRKKSNGEMVPDTSNEILNTILKSAPLQSLNLDEVAPESVYVARNDILGTRFGEDMTEFQYLRGVNGMVMKGDSIYVAAAGLNNIWVMDREGVWQRTIGRTGSGPGEFGILKGLYKNSGNFFAADPRHMLMHTFNHQWKHTGSFDLLIPWPRMQFAFTDLWMLVPGKPADSDLIQVRETIPPYEEKRTLLPRLIPSGNQPQGYNFFSAFTNHSDVIAICYFGLPYLFIYNENLEHMLTLNFSSKVFDQYESESSPPVPVAGGEGDILQVMPYFSAITITDEGTIYLSTNDRTLYRIEHTNRGYRVKNGWIIYYSDPEPGMENQARRLGINHIITDSDTLLISSEFVPYLFRLYPDHLY